MKMLDPKEAEQLVLDQMDHDPARHQGPRVIRHKLALRTGHHLTHNFVMDTMQTHDIAGFLKRDPTAKCIHREPKVPLGINEWWSADGHDKLYGIGFPIWAMVDDATGKWLDIFVVPSNRMGRTIAYLFLALWKMLVVSLFNQLCESLELTLLEECHFKPPPIVGQRLLNFMELRRPYGELHWCFSLWIEVESYIYLFKWLFPPRYWQFRDTSSCICEECTQYCHWTFLAAFTLGVWWQCCHLFQESRGRWNIPCPFAWTHVCWILYFQNTNLNFIWITPGNCANGSGQSSSVSWRRSSWRVEIHTDLVATTPSLALLECLAMRPIAFHISGVVSNAFLELIWRLSTRSRTSWVMVMTCFVFLLSLLNLSMRPTKFTTPFISRIFLLPMSGMSFVQCYPFYFLECTFPLSASYTCTFLP